MEQENKRLIPFRKNKMWGFSNERKKITINCKYEIVNQFFEGLASVKKNGKYGYIDTLGKETIPFYFEDAWKFSNGFARGKKMASGELLINLEMIFYPAIMI